MMFAQRRTLDHCANVIPSSAILTYVPEYAVLLILSTNGSPATLIAQRANGWLPAARSTSTEAMWAGFSVSGGRTNVSV